MLSPHAKRRGTGLRHRLPLFLILALLAGLWAAATPTPAGRREVRLGAIAGAQTFSLARWEARTIGAKVAEAVGPGPGAGLTPDERERIFKDFFATADEANRLEGEIGEIANQGSSAPDPRLADLERQLRELRAKREKQSSLVERTIEEQVLDVLRQERLALFEVGTFFFPPVFTKLVDLPHVLVVSPRDRIEMKHQVTVRRAMTTAEIEALESAVDSDLNVSSLVVPIGGLSTYPTMIAATGPLDFVIGAVTHEWCHIYLIFRPLGLSYGKNPEATTINETVCSIMGEDAAAQVREQYYGAAKAPRPWQATPTPIPTAPPRREEPQGFNANRDLRKVYVAVEERLKVKDVTGAEAIMEEGRTRLAENGFYLRKLNLAFFAFYGSYAEGPDDIRPDPIGENLRELRRRSPTLRDFMRTVSGVTTFDDLKRRLGR